MKRIRAFIREESVLLILLVLFVILNATIPGHIAEFHTFIDWKTIVTLLALITVSTGLKESGYLNRFASRVLSGIRDERTLALFLISLSAGLSAFLTNDITLFIVVPVTVAMGKLIKNDIGKLVIFEALAVNAGSTLTAIGNPQNIFLWHKWGIHFFIFSVKMVPLVVLLLAVLYLFVCIVFKPAPLHFGENAAGVRVHRGLGALSAGLLAVFLVALQFGAGHILLPFIILAYMFYNRKVLLDVDWLLIATFILMFIDFALIAKAGAVRGLAGMVDLTSQVNAYLVSLGLSQVMSNVPAAIFISRFSAQWPAITAGVNVAGNGFIIGSLANIIALRLLKSNDPGIWIEFHKYSIPYFAITAFIVFLFFLR